MAREREPLRDTRGTPVTVDAEVAFNLSGEVARGRVKKIVESTRYKSKHNPEGYPYWTIHVELLHDVHRYYTAGRISKMTSPRNLLVLMAKED